MVATGLFSVVLVVGLSLSNSASGITFRKRNQGGKGAVAFHGSVALSKKPRHCDCISDNGLPTRKLLNGGGEFVYHKEGNFPKDYGESCKAWEAKSAACQSDYPPAYCAEKWCYVHPECEAADVKKSMYFPGKTLYYSYQNCGSLDAFTAQACLAKGKDDCSDPCAWNKGICQNALCQCTGENTGVDTAEFGKKYGQSCKAWDQKGCEKWEDGNALGLWCCKQWCYVPDSCPSAKKSAASSNLYYSYYACPDEPHELTTCPWKEPITFAGDPLPLTPKASEALSKLPKKCNCVANELETEEVDGKEMIVHKDGSMYPAKYGEHCKAWEVESDACKGKAYPPAYCPEKWCYVDSECEAADVKKSLYFPGTELTYSYQTCGSVDAFTAQACFAKDKGNCTDPCAWNNGICQNQLCQCTGHNKGVDAKEYGDNYGMQCAAHDQKSCEKWEGTSDLGLWCCKSWCYVDETCPSAKPSSAGAGLFYSYYACPDNPKKLTSCDWRDPVDFSGEPLPLTGEAAAALEKKGPPSTPKLEKDSKSGARGLELGFPALLLLLLARGC